MNNIEFQKSPPICSLAAKPRFPSYLSSQGIVNRDIKLENTLLDNSPRPLVKLCDFGYSKHEKFQSAPGSRVGTPAYLAPEVILTTKGKTYDGKVRGGGTVSACQGGHERTQRAV